MYEQLANQLSRPNRITFTKVNVDEQQDIAKAYGITAYVLFMSFLPPDGSVYFFGDGGVQDKARQMQRTG